MLKRLKDIDRIIKNNNLEPNTVTLIGKHILGRCLKKDKWIICHIKDNNLTDCKVYDTLDDAIEVMSELLKRIK